DRVGFRFLRDAALDGHKARAKAINAGCILITGGLIDLPLAAELGFERYHGDAIRLPAAIAAAFADGFIDDNALAGIRHLAALAATALLGGANLIVNQHGDARPFA